MSSIAPVIHEINLSVFNIVLIYQTDRYIKSVQGGGAALSGRSTSQWVGDLDKGVTSDHLVRLHQMGGCEN